MKNTKYKTLCTRAITDDISAEEKKHLEQWLERAPENRQYFERISSAWELSQPVDVPFIEDPEDGWAHIESSLNLTTNSLEQKRKAKGSSSRLSEWIRTFSSPGLRPVAYALGALLLIAGSLTIYRQVIDNAPFIEVVTHDTQRLETTLPDGSQVHLNADSRILFAKLFSCDIREIKLSGEAFFDVVSENRPFIVVTENARTTVMGTRFNVRTRGEKTCVIVQEGRVKVSPSSENLNEVILTKDQLSEVAGTLAPTEPRTVDSDFLLGWRRGKLIFVKTSVTEIIDELQRYYGVDIHLVDGAISSQTITASFDHVSIETVLQSICLTLGTSFQQEGKHYHIGSSPPGGAA